MSSLILIMQFFSWDRLGRKYHNVDWEGAKFPFKFPFKRPFVWEYIEVLTILSELEVCRKRRMKDIESNILKDRANGKSEDDQVGRVRILIFARDAFF